MKKSTLKWIIVIAAVAALLMFLWTVDTSAYWKTKAGTDQFELTINGQTTLIGKDGNPIKLMVAQKISMLSFYYQNIEVTQMVVTLTWTANGKDVDWNTLQLTITASGTGGYSSTKTFTTKSGSTSFSLPITTTQLGYTPSSGQQITWQMTINIIGTVQSAVGTTLTAQANPITCQVTTVYYEPTFTITSSASSSTDGSTSSGGCGPPGHHLIWVYNVQPEGPSKIQNIFPLIGMTIYATIAATTIYHIKKSVKNKK